MCTLLDAFSHITLAYIPGIRPINTVNYEPTTFPVSKCYHCKHKGHNDQDYMSLDCSLEGTELVMTATHLLTLLTATGPQRLFLSQSRDSLVFQARYLQWGDELFSPVSSERTARGFHLI